MNVSTTCTFNSSIGGLGLNQTLTSSALRMGGIGSGTSTSAGMGMGMGLGQRPPILGIGTAQQHQRPTGLGLGLNTGQTSMFNIYTCTCIY